MVFKSFSISRRLLSFVATMTFGSMAFAAVPTPTVSLTNEFGDTGFSYTLQVTQAPETTGTAFVHDGKMYVQEDKEYTFKLTVTEADKWYIGIQPTKDGGVTLDYDKRNGSRDGAGPNTTYIYVAKTFTNAGTHVIAKAFYYKGDDFSYTDMETVDIEVNIIDANELTITEALHLSNTTNDLTQADQTNMLYVCQTSNDTATVGLDFTWKPEGVSSNQFYWQIRTLDDGDAPEWGTEKSDFESDPATNLVWTLPTSSTTNREFLIRAWYDCDEDSAYTNTEPHRIVHVTIARLDVTIDGIAETNEETVGAILAFEPDATNNVWTTAGSNSLKAVSIKCWPENLSTNEIIKIEVPEGFLYEKIGDVYTNAQTSYVACEVGQKKFFLHGHVTSKSLRDCSIMVTHETSGAKDNAKFTVFDVMAGVKIADEYGLVWGLSGTYNKKYPYKVMPDPAEFNIIWYFENYCLPGTKVQFTPQYIDMPNMGSGNNVKLNITYEGVNGKRAYNDLMPPDNRWFGRKTLVIGIGSGMLTIKRSFLVVFDSEAERKTNEYFSTKVSAWYYYYTKGNVVKGLSEFQYLAGQDALVAKSIIHRFPPYTEFFIGKSANSINDSTIIGGYHEIPYKPGKQGVGCHAVAKVCLHEKTHVLLWGQCSSTSDTDSDGLPDKLEQKIGTTIGNRDTYDLSAAYDNNAGYKKSGDQELYCRMAQSVAEGFENYDWAHPKGAQFFNEN